MTLETNKIDHSCYVNEQNTSWQQTNTARLDIMYIYNLQNRDDRPSFAMTHMRRFNHIACFNHNACLTSWGYFVISPNGEESLNKILSEHPDPDNILGGPSHGYVHPV